MFTSYVFRSEYARIVKSTELFGIRRVATPIQFHSVSSPIHIRRRTIVPVCVFCICMRFALNQIVLNNFDFIFIVFFVKFKFLLRPRGEMTNIYIKHMCLYREATSPPKQSCDDGIEWTHKQQRKIKNSFVA